MVNVSTVPFCQLPTDICQKGGGSYAAEFNMQHQYVFGPSGRGSFLPKFSYHETLHVAIMGLTVGRLPEVVGHRIGNIGRLNEFGGEVDGGRVLTGTFASSSPDLDKVFNASM